MNETRAKESLADWFWSLGVYGLSRALGLYGLSGGMDLLEGVGYSSRAEFEDARSDDLAEPAKAQSSGRKLARMPSQSRTMVGWCELLPGTVAVR